MAPETKESKKQNQVRQDELDRKELEDKKFDWGAPPPFKIGEVRAAIPAHCWVKSPWRSMSYVLRDFLVIAALMAMAMHFESVLIMWPFYWFAQGTMFWALFSLGHDTGHGSFSDNATLNSIVGHVTHTFILMPYHGWRIGHKIHHQNTGHIERDQSWHPLPEKTYNSLSSIAKKMRFTFPYALVAFPSYLWYGTRPGTTEYHFSPNSELYVDYGPEEKSKVLISTMCWSMMLGMLVSLSWTVGFIPLFKLYWVPYLVFVVWIDLVTYLHHHGLPDLPWYRGKEWSYLRGALTTVDRDYGWINNIHHDIGTHVIHHLFPQIPHYHLVEATKTAKHVLGNYYREPKKSGPIPFHLFGILMRSLRVDHFVSDEGDVVYYQSDPAITAKYHKD